MVKLPDVIKTTIKLPPDLHEWIRKYAFDNHISMGKVFRELAQKLREKEEKKK